MKHGNGDSVMWKDGYEESAELETSTRQDGITESVSHGVLVWEDWQLEQVHAGAGARQPLPPAPAGDAEGRVQLPEAQQGRSAAASHKLEQLLTLVLREAIHDLPKPANPLVLSCVLAWGGRRGRGSHTQQGRF